MVDTTVAAVTETTTTAGPAQTLTTVVARVTAVEAVVAEDVEGVTNEKALAG
jgi:hypothetical protein